jgi:hypothetical protein
MCILSCLGVEADHADAIVTAVLRGGEALAIFLDTMGALTMATTLFQLDTEDKADTRNELVCVYCTFPFTCIS